MHRALVVTILMLSGCAEFAPYNVRQPDPDLASQQTPEQKKESRTGTPTMNWGKSTSRPADQVQTTNLEVATTPTDKDSQSLSWLIATIAAALVLGWVLKRFYTARAKPTETNHGSKEDGLSREIEALTKLVAAKTREAEALAAKLKDRQDLKILQRVAQFQHALDFNRELMVSGKLDAMAAVKEIEAELEAALDELGIAPFPIEVGANIRKLPEGSFELIDSCSPPSPALAGTVSKVRQRALTYKDSTGQAHFLIPAKIDAYKL